MDLCAFVEDVVGTAVLQAPQGCVEAAFTYEVVVGAALADLAAFEDDDFIGMANGGQAMGHDEEGSASG